MPVVYELRRYVSLHIINNNNIQTQNKYWSLVRAWSSVVNSWMLPCTRIWRHFSIVSDRRFLLDINTYSRMVYV